MFLRWLITTFPFEMRQGLARLRPDLVLWLALSILVTVAFSAMGGPTEETPAPAFVPAVIRVGTAILMTMLPALLFTAQLEGRELTWKPVLLLIGRKAGALVTFEIVTNLVALAMAIAMANAVSLALGDSPLAVPASLTLGFVIAVSVLVRFTFLPFVLVLTEREQLPEGLWQWNRLPALAAFFWPLTVSVALTDGNIWRLAVYQALLLVLPFASFVVPPAALFPASVLASLVGVMIQGVFFEHYRRRCEETACPAPHLPFSPSAEAEA